LLREKSSDKNLTNNPSFFHLIKLFFEAIKMRE